MDIARNVTYPTSPSLTSGPIGRGLRQLALPIVYTQILQTLNGTINSVWLGHFVGEAALAASSNGNVVVGLLTGISLGITTSAAILVGHSAGANDVHAPRRVLANSIVFFLVLSVVITIVGQIASHRLLVAMNTPAQSLPLALSYMRVIFLTLPCFYVYALVASVLAGAGDSKTPFHFSLLSVAIDICLNPILIFGIGSLPKLGVAGSALATFIAQCTSLAALVCHLYRKRHPLCLYKNDFGSPGVDFQIVGTLLRKGVPIGAQTVLFPLSNVLMYALVNRFGTGTAAAFGASQQLWRYIEIPAWGISAAVSFMAAHNIGANRWDRIDSIARAGAAYSILLTGSCLVVIDVLAPYAYRLFLPAGSQALYVAAHIIRIGTLSTVFLGVSFVLLGVTRANGAVIAPLLLQISAFVVARILVANTLLNKWHADAIWWSFPVSSALACVLALLYYRFGNWRAEQKLFRIRNRYPVEKV